MTEQTNNTQAPIEGIVTSSTGSWYEVATNKGSLNCRIRGRLRLKGVRSTNPVVVGDRVMVEPDGDNSAIVEILPRRNYVIRRASNLSKESHIIAANIDRALLLITLHSPTTPREFVDRFLVTCEAYKVPVTIVIGKADKLENEALEEADEFTAIYEDAGYEVMRLSSVTGEGVDEITLLGMLLTVARVGYGCYVQENIGPMHGKVCCHGIGIGDIKFAMTGGKNFILALPAMHKAAAYESAASGHQYFLHVCVRVLLGVIPLADRRYARPPRSIIILILLLNSSACMSCSMVRCMR